MHSLNDVWNHVCSIVKKEMSEVAYTSWIRCLTPVDLTDDVVTLSALSDFQAKTAAKYKSLLSQSFESVLGFPVELKFVSEEKKEEVPSFLKGSMEPIFASNGEANNSSYEYTFDTFIVGSSNKFAHAASLAVAANPAGAYNPLFIYGPSGLGKTHLLNAIKNEIYKNNSSMNIVYIKGDDFANDLINAIKEGKTNDVRNKYRYADVLLVDDIHFIAGKTQTQEEFFHTFNTLYETHKQLVLTSDKPPKEMQTLEERLRTRFEWGLIADIQPPDFETRVAIMKRKADLVHIQIPNEVIEYVANRLKSNIRQLEGAVKKLKAYYMLDKELPSIPLAQMAIRDILNSDQPVQVTIDKIINEVCRTFSVTEENLKSKMRSAAISQARQVAMYVVRQVTRLSLPQIGAEFGGRDHSTVIYAMQAMERETKKNAYLKQTIEDIIKNITEN